MQRFSDFLAYFLTCFKSNYGSGNTHDRVKGQGPVYRVTKSLHHAKNEVSLKEDYD